MIEKARAARHTTGRPFLVTRAVIQAYNFSATDITQAEGEIMAEEKFDENLMRLMAAHLHFLSGMMAAREMFGRGYFSLGLGEKAAVDQAVIGAIVGN